MRTVVETASGRLQGAVERDTLVFRGIPYARPPVDEFAFRAPAPPDPWAGVRDATRFGKAAPQPTLPLGPFRKLVGAASSRQSADCLTLNVWTPAADAGRRPVMVWIHGGAFVLGTGATFLYHGARLAERGDAVVVTINYRLGAMGFLGHPELRARGLESNLGIRDQVRALEWVRDHIAAFGGDPGNVTIFGESAGGMSVGTLLAVPSARGLFHRAILQSGAMHHVSSEAQAAQVAETFVEALGLTPEDAEGVRHARIGALLEAQQVATVRTGVRYGTLPWQPYVDGDVLPRTALESLGKGEVARVPTLIGTNRDEWRLFTAFDPLRRTFDESELQSRLAHVLASPDEVATALELYRTNRRGRTPMRIWESVMSDRIFHHPAQRAADGLAALGVPVWRYMFAWRPPVLRGRIGAGHAMELPLVFGTLADGMLRPMLGSSRVARRLSRRMQDAWLGFARDADPGHERLPEWPAYDLEERATLVLDADSHLVSAPFAAESAFWLPRLG